MGKMQILGDHCFSVHNVLLSFSRFVECLLSNTKCWIIVPVARSAQISNYRAEVLVWKVVMVGKYYFRYWWDTEDNQLEQSRKKEWNEDTLHDLNIKVLLLGSSRVLLEKELSESLVGRF